MTEHGLIPVERVEKAILFLRGQKVIIDEALAELYGVTTKRLNEQVKRNPERFPPDFSFQLSEEEVAALRSQFATLKTGRGRHRKYRPYAFTEHGALMARKSSFFSKPSASSWILHRSPHAASVSVGKGNDRQLSSPRVVRRLPGRVETR